ncbi:PH-like domain-containing protein [Microbacterium halophytorum]|uniref:PH-like domain-containing protein n=1 Tax=Microbacterium halophytorum TaxID=2067568 RepID=UPI000CFBBF68|nr:hypothetical protein [Microbacterium halophytorum]
MLDYLPGIAFFVAVIALVLFAMWWGWRARRKRSASVVAPQAPVRGAEVAVFDGLYVATTRHGDPLDRLVVPGLAFRSRVHVTVTSAGVALAMPGSHTLFLDADRISGAGRATWTIDRVVERDGLVLIAWRSDDGTICDSYIRLQTASPDALVSAIDDLKALPTGAEQ